MSWRAKKIAVLIAVFSLLVAACGSASDEVAEQLAEELIEASGGGDVNVEVSGDGDDMTIEMETEDGTFSMGMGTELPEGLEIPVPDGGDVMTAVTAEGLISVSLIYEHARYDELVSFYESWTRSTGDTWDTQTLSMDAGEGTQRSTMFASEDGAGFVLVGDCSSIESEGNELDSACVTINQGG